MSKFNVHDDCHVSQIVTLYCTCFGDGYVIHYYNAHQNKENYITLVIVHIMLAYNESNVVIIAHWQT